MQHCIFDLYGTLVDIHTDEDAPEFWQAMAKEYASFGAKFTPEQLHETYRYLVNQEETALRGSTEAPEIQLDQVFCDLFTLGGVTADSQMVQTIARRFRAHSTEYLRLYDGVPEMLAALRRAGKKIWLLSNAQHLFTAWELDRLGLTDCFDGIYLSSDYGCKKPDARFFRFLLDEHNIPADDAIMVGNDAACDIAGAKKVGLHTLYIRSNLTPKDDISQGDHILEEMDIAKVQEILLSL